MESMIMQNLISVLLFAVSTTLTPGPNNFMLMSSGLNYGPRRSLPHFLGVCLGFPLMFLILALGFGVVFIKFAVIKHILKILGSAYLLYLAFKILNSSNATDKISEDSPFTFFHAVMFQWINPKAWLMAISAISIYTVSDHYFYSVIYMSIIFLLVCIPCAGVWLFMGTKIKQYLTTDNHRRIFNFCMAAALIGSIGMIFFD
jgi:threonine/homoserine/homoserine lactone efflux protein